MTMQHSQFGVPRPARARRTVALATAVCLSAALALSYDNAGAQSAAVPPLCQGLPATIWGNNNANLLQGGAGNDVIAGLGGDDTILGGGGNDILCGDGGRDMLRGQDGNDRLFGNADDDQLFGGNGADHLDGGTHNVGDLCDLGPGGLTRTACEF
ncbi:MAG TPA: calcium-binding protein [Solirubrobacteraceae bacterium]|jgi:hypothetical protein|nr:calcium-binding protein [Solirubrobacteraceae bacterium]